MSGIKRADKVRELRSVWIPPEEQPEAGKKKRKKERGIKTLTNRGGDGGTLKKCHVFEPFGRGS